MKTISGLASLTLSALAPLAAIDVTPVYGPDDVRVGMEALSKQLYDGKLLLDDAVARVYGSARYYGVGFSADGYLALGSDDTTQGRDVNPLESTQVNARLDYLFEYTDEQEVPIFQIIPKLTWTTMPNQPSSWNDDYKNNLLWLGAEAWYMLPWEGLEVGGSFEVNTPDGFNYVRGAIGAREFFQQYSPFDLFFWQTLNFSDGQYNKIQSGSDEAGLTFLDIGGKITYPMPFQQTWMYVKADIQMWVNGDSRDRLHEAGLDGGNFVMGVGVEWIAE